MPPPPTTELQPSRRDVSDLATTPRLPHAPVNQTHRTRQHGDGADYRCQSPPTVPGAGAAQRPPEGAGAARRVPRRRAAREREVAVRRPHQEAVERMRPLPVAVEPWSSRGDHGGLKRDPRLGLDRSQLVDQLRMRGLRRRLRVGLVPDRRSVRRAWRREAPPDVVGLGPSNEEAAVRPSRRAPWPCPSIPWISPDGVDQTVRGYL